MATLRGVMRAVPLEVVAAAASIVVIEAATDANVRYVVETAIAATALALAWRRQAELRPAGIVVFALTFSIALAVVHLAQGTGGDQDVQSVYGSEGGLLTHGVYPHSEYPPGAVLLFALEAAIASPRVVNPFVMAVCAAAIAAMLSGLATAEARWLALAVVLWPVNTFFWEWKFDALPTALLAAGALAAVRQRWGLAGLAFGMGAAVKWTPALSALMLAAWLLSRRDIASFRAHVAGFVVAFGTIVLPFLVWSPSAVWASVERQAPRGVIGESIWYYPLHAFGKGQLNGAIYDPMRTSSWANTAAVSLQLLAVIALVVLLIRRRPPLEEAVALALCAPIVFLLLNKVFSAQYMLTIAIAAAAAAVLQRRVLIVASLMAVATFANLLVYPVGRSWSTASAVLFASSLVAVSVLAWRSGPSEAG
jgi:hypothetical protein